MPLEHKSTESLRNKSHVYHLTLHSPHLFLLAEVNVALCVILDNSKMLIFAVFFIVRCIYYSFSSLSIGILDALTAISSSSSLSKLRFFSDNSLIILSFSLSGICLNNSISRVSLLVSCCSSIVVSPVFSLILARCHGESSNEWGMSNHPSDRLSRPSSFLARAVPIFLRLVIIWLISEGDISHFNARSVWVKPLRWITVCRFFKRISLISMLVSLLAKCFTAYCCIVISCANVSTLLITNTVWGFLCPVYCSQSEES
ncbi:putative membrane protein [Escherichia coli T924_01]|nr:putative prophage protein [Escherichia coli VR50]EFI85855.1 hypothetical protein HMPREF9551_05197 [Escherichia coli MS 196-1]ERC87159.1 putative membrane protein [Escherichia coli T924_01]